MGAKNLFYSPKQGFLVWGLSENSARAQEDWEVEGRAANEDLLLLAPDKITIFISESYRSYY